MRTHTPHLQQRLSVMTMMLMNHSMSAPAGFTQERLDGWYGENAIGAQHLYDPDQHWLGTALSGFGIMASQAAAELVAAHVLAQALPEYATAFLPGRFDDPSYRRGLAAADARRGQL